MSDVHCPVIIYSSHFHNSTSTAKCCCFSLWKWVITSVWVVEFCSILCKSLLINCCDFCSQLLNWKWRFQMSIQWDHLLSELSVRASSFWLVTSQLVAASVWKCWPRLDGHQAMTLRSVWDIYIWLCFLLLLWLLLKEHVQLHYIRVI